MGYVQIGNRTFTKSMPIGTTTNDQLLPFPNILAQGVNTGTNTSQITDTTKNFLSMGITPGMVAMRLVSGGASRIITNVTATQLTLSGTISIAAGDAYIVYPAGGIKGTPYDGALIMNNSAGGITVTIESMSGEVMNINVPAFTTCPIQASRIIANAFSVGAVYALY